MSNRPPHIAVLSLAALYDARVANHLATLVDAGFEVAYINGSKGNALPDMPQLQRVRLVQRHVDPRVGLNPVKLWQLQRWMLRAAHETDADLYQIDDLLLLPLAYRLRGRRVYDAFENYRNWPGRMGLYARVMYPIFLPFVDGCAGAAGSYLPRTTKPSVIVPNCQRRAAFDAVEAEPREGIHVVYIGSLSTEDRRPHLMIDAAQRVLDSCPAARFTFGGPCDDAVAQRLTDMAARHDTRFSWRGVLPRNEVIAVTKSADIGMIFVKPTSPNLRGGSWNKIYEYLTVGAAIVATDGFDIAAEVRAAGAGALFDPACSVMDVADAIAALINEPQRLGQMRSASADLGRQYTWEQVGSRYLDLYRQLGVAAGGP